METIKKTIEDIVLQAESSEKLKKNFGSKIIIETLQPKIEKIIQQRLDELTPQMVKEIIQKIIREHLGWLVLWGGVFGGFIGLVTTFF